MKRDVIPPPSIELTPGLNLTLTRDYADVDNPADAVAGIQVRDGGVNPDLVPQFGITPGVNPTGTGNCDGTTNAAGAVIEIPCSCPPDRNSFIQALNANVAAGHPVNNPGLGAFVFSDDPSPEFDSQRLTSSIVTLQNLFGAGVGCPAASTTFVAQLAAIKP